MKLFQKHSFPIDHFGIAASHLIQEVVNQSSDKRKRKSAFNQLVGMAKATKQIPKGTEVQSIGLLTDKAGQLWLVFTEEVPAAGTLSPEQEIHL